MEAFKLTREVPTARGLRTKQRSLWIKNGRYQLTYKPGEWTEAKVGGCLVFPTVEAARQHVYATSAFEKHARLRLWKVEVEEEVSLPSVRLAEKDTRWFRKLWRTGMVPLNREYWPNKCWPEDTKAFKRVKLVEQVELRRWNP